MWVIVDMVKLSVRRPLVFLKQAPVSVLCKRQRQSFNLKSFEEILHGLCVFFGNITSCILSFTHFVFYNFSLGNEMCTPIAVVDLSM